jgi:hypothetical protein
MSLESRRALSRQAKKQTSGPKPERDLCEQNHCRSRQNGSKNQKALATSREHKAPSKSAQEKQRQVESATHTTEQICTTEGQYARHGIICAGLRKEPTTNQA